jgi:hypothetical protein
MLNVCGKPMARAKNGKSRRTCTRPAGHVFKHGNETCVDCAARLTSSNCPPSWINRTGKRSGICRTCAASRRRSKRNQQPQNYQLPEKEYTFRNCGCAGVLPKKGQHNKFAKSGTNGIFHCRVSRIISVSQIAARERGYAPIPQDTSHSAIRKLMAEPNCERCREPLMWDFAQGKTPHLHHDHETGEVFGFTHPICNPRALERELERLRKSLGTRRGPVISSVHVADQTENRAVPKRERLGRNEEAGEEIGRVGQLLNSRGR